ncbi:MAG: endopeptidase La [Gammaproteobacteria bacterium]
MNEHYDNDPEIIEQVEEVQQNALVLPDSSLPDRLYVLPISNKPYFPAQVQPIVVDEDPWLTTLERVSKTPHKCLALCWAPEPADSIMLPDRFARMGCVVRVHNVVRSEGKIQFIAQGIRRVWIHQWLQRQPPLLASVTYPSPRQEDAQEVKAYAIAIIDSIKELVSINPLYSEELRSYLDRFSPNEPSPLTDFAAGLTTAEAEDLQEVLDTVPMLKRMEKVLLLLKKELEVARLHMQINKQVNAKLMEHQRNFFLREQLKVIQKELGISKDDKESDADEFRARLQRCKVPPAAMKKIEEELHKLSMLESGSPEYAVTRNYLDWSTSVPWGVFSNDNLDIRHARKVLDKGHDGLDDVKDRIIEFLAVGAYKGEISGSILLLVGPPGVGKTSIGKSIADALGRPFYRFSLGGMRDEAEIKGHRRTYIGAMPGKLVQALKDVEVANPVIMLDEIDKIGASYQGDPASALLEVLDPEQNKEFLDHYLDLRIDLSKVLFVCTANQLDTIPGPLLDRMDVIRLSGYITEEKVAIARNHLWPKALQRAGVKKSLLKISVTALRAIIEGYARESGVRNLEKNLNKIVRKAVVRLLDKPADAISVTPENLEEFLGSPIFRDEKPITGIGVVTGLAWTSLGGATLPIEATVVHHRNSGFKLTGQLGDVMKESAEIAHSYVSAHIQEYGGDPTFFEKAFIHLHVPEGATPKDGPSAGITMSTALISLACNRQLSRPIAMTGEITLTGQVLPVGGIREKVIAARRQKIRELILPAANKRDFDELPDYIRKGLTVHFAEHYQDVYQAAFRKR